LDTGVSLNVAQGIVEFAKAAFVSPDEKLATGEATRKPATTIAVRAL
jgi:hypothetical protein